MSSPDGFDRGRELTELVREELRDIRRDVDAAVEAEVRRVAVDPARLEGVVREAVRRELDARIPPWLSHMRWMGPAFGVLLGLALGLGAVALYSARGPLTDADALSVATAPALEASRTAGEPPDAAAARYDSLFVARAPIFAPLIARADSLGPPALRTAATAWRAGTASAEQAARLHDAFVQLALRDHLDATLTVDGGILRNPCRGASCEALLALWRTRGDEIGMPPAADTSALPIAERVLVLRAMENEQ